MGKASDNERLKLRATFFNSVGIGLLLAGFLIPYLFIFSQAGVAVEWLISDRVVTFAGAARIAGTFAGMVSAFTGARQFRRKADEIASKIQD